MRETIVLTDNTPYTDSDISKVKKAYDALKEARIHDLSFNFSSKNIKKRDVIKKVSDEKYETGKYVGFFSGRDEKGNEYDVEIKSRFDNSEGNFFLRCLLEESFSDSIREKELDRFFTDYIYRRSSGGVDDIVNSMVIISFIELFSDLINKGYYKCYKTFGYNDSRINGTIDIPSYIKYDIPFNGKIAYQRREYTRDNDYNRLFLSALNVIKQNKEWNSILSDYYAKNRNFEKQVTDLKYEVSEWDNANGISRLLNNTSQRILHPYLLQYEQLRILARLIVSSLGLRALGSNLGEYQIQGILIDINTLWEFYIKVKILDELQFKYQESRNILCSGNSEGREIRPDFDRGGVVFDAKNKPVWGDVFRKGEWKDDTRKRKDDTIRNDVYQLISYMHILECKKGGFIFPYNKKDNTDSNEIDYDGASRGLRNCGDNERIYLLPLAVPTVKDSGNDLASKELYKKFKDELEENTLDLKNYIKSICQNQS